MIDYFIYPLPFFVTIGLFVYIWSVFKRRDRSVEALRKWAIDTNLQPVAVTESDALPFFKLVNYDRPVLYRGVVDGRVLTVGFGIADFHEDDTVQPVPLFFAQCRLLGRVNGEALIRPPGVQWLGKLEYTALESTKFRGYNSVWTSPKKLSTQIVSPDFMDWYERQRPRPAIYINSDACCILFQRYANRQELENIGQQIAPILRFIERSGALVKTL